MLSPGTRIDGRYEIVATLGSGGMGHVYRAHRLHLGDEVAIKVMQTSEDSPPELRERFLRESRACAQLRHPNIVSLLDFGFDEGKQPFMVMELLSGPSLKEEIQLEAPMAPARVASILRPVAAALQLAHDRGITHRDLKPANIVAHRYESGDRVYKVIDFGLAAMKATNDETRLTDPQMFLGTLAYAAPEQMRGDPITPATDIYSLAVIAYEMLTGGLPFDPGNRMTMINQLLTAMPVRPAAQRNGLPDAIDAAVMRALAKDPSERWPTVQDFAAALEEAGEPNLASESNLTNRTNLSNLTNQQEAGLLSRYELGAVLGRGRNGSVIYRGTHRMLGVPVAIRVLKRDDQPHWDTVRARFLLEARTLQVSHPSLLQVRDFGEDDRAVYLVTDFIEGPSLREAFAKTGAFPWPRAAALLRQALDGMSALHRKGGFIAGVNPDMVRLRVMEPERARSPEPGARPAPSAVEGSPEQIVMSTAGVRSVQDVLATMREQELRGQEASERELPYVPPEVLMGGGPSVRADVFTIGVLAYQMVTGRAPYQAPSLPELIGQMLQAKPPAPIALNATVPAAASDAILRAIDSVPANRFESAESFSNAIFV